jgi:DNA-binding SARP family transcriptional activator
MDFVLMKELANTKGKVQLNLLGTFQITSPDGQEIVLQGRKKKWLMAYLALSRDCSASRNQAVSVLWGQRDSAKQANPSLRTALSELRKLFGAANHADVLDSDRTSISLNLEQIRVDTTELKRLGKSQTIGDKRLALDFYRGDLLEGLDIKDRAFEEWIYIERIQYRELYREILHDLMTHALKEQSFSEGVRIANRILALDNTDEEAHRTLMMMYRSEGNHARALKQFQICGDVLQRELEIMPSAETLNLYEEIKSANSVAEPAPRIEQAVIARNVLRSRDRLSIGVVPFWSQGGGMESDFLASGIAEDIIGALSRFKWMSVVPRSATFSLRPEIPETVRIGEKLKLKYIVDGSVQLTGNSIKVMVELIEVGATKVLWYEHYEVMLDNRLDVQNEITSKVVSQIDAHLRREEVSQAMTWSTDNPKANDCLMLAISNMHEMTRESFLTERNLFKKAVQLNPNFATVYSWWALREIFYIGQGWGKDWSQDSHDGESPIALAKKAISLDSGDAIALAICAHSKSFMEHDFAGALEYFERSMTANPNSAFTWMLSSATYSYCGEPEEALRRLEHSTYLCPVEPLFDFMYSSSKCLAHSFARQYKEAATWGRRLVRESPNFTNGIKQLLVPLGHLGEAVEAREYTRRLLELEPEFTIGSYRRRRPFKNPEDREEFVEGLIKAGVPDE